MKNFALLFFLFFFISCSSSSTNSIDFFGKAYYKLQPNEKVLKYVNTPIDDLFKQTVSVVFNEQQFPVYRIVKNENAYVYVTIPLGMDFSSFRFNTMPENSHLIDKNENDELKYLAFENNNMFISIYLRKIKHNSIGLLSFASDKAKFNQIGTQQIIDEKIQLHEK